MSIYKQKAERQNPCHSNNNNNSLLFRSNTAYRIYIYKYNSISE